MDAKTARLPFAPPGMSANAMQLQLPEETLPALLRDHQANLRLQEGSKTIRDLALVTNHVVSLGHAIEFVYFEMLGDD